MDYAYDILSELFVWGLSHDITIHDVRVSNAAQMFVFATQRQNRSLFSGKNEVLNHPFSDPRIPQGELNIWDVKPGHRAPSGSGHAAIRRWVVTIFLWRMRIDGWLDFRMISCCDKVMMMEVLLYTTLNSSVIVICKSRCINYQ